MPFKSDRQRRFMFAKHPQIAQRWVNEAHEQGKPVVQPDAQTQRLAAALRSHAKRRGAA